MFPSLFYYVFNTFSGTFFFGCLDIFFVVFCRLWVAVWPATGLPVAHGQPCSWHLAIWQGPGRQSARQMPSQPRARQAIGPQTRWRAIQSAHSGSLRFHNVFLVELTWPQIQFGSILPYMGKCFRSVRLLCERFHRVFTTFSQRFHNVFLEFL